MDFGNAALLVVGLYGLIEMVKTAVNGTNKQRITLAIVVGSAVAAVFTLSTAHTFGHSQVVGGVPLDRLGIADRFVVAFFLGAVASGVNTAIVKPISNIGQNQPISTPTYTPPPAPAAVGTSGVVPPHPDTIPSPPGA